MDESEDKEFIRLEDTDAVTIGSDGKPRVKLTIIDKSGRLPDDVC
ncbi:MAG: hypothetical protein U5K37_08545 [Natrialbaceae archaeon]|nr:hypothetical protein [Natrialbaceae archaeon]